MSDRLLTLAEAAEALAVSSSTVKRRVAAGLLPVFRDGRIVRVRESDLRRYISGRLGEGGAGGRELLRPAVVRRRRQARGRLWD